MHRSFNPPGSSLPAVLLAAAAALCSIQVHAQAQPQAQTGTGSVQQILGNLWGTETDISVGAGAGLDQRYMGARDFRPLLLPMISVSRGIFFIDTIKGAGVQYLSASGFYIGDGFNYDPGRDDENDLWRPGSNNLRGMGDVKGTITNTLTVSQQIVPWLSINAQAEFGLDGSRGNQYQFGLESVPYHTMKDSLTLDLDAKMGDSTYNQTYFGVTQAQSSSSGFARYSPGFGIYAYSLTATWKHTFDKHWSTVMLFTGSLYTSKAANSPIVQRKYGITLLPTLNYAF